jgi:hypothetical protein
VLLFGFVSTVHAQAELDFWSCSASPPNVQEDTLCYGAQTTYTSSGASAGSTGFCHNSAVIGTYASATTTATSGGTAESEAQADDRFYAYPGGGRGGHGGSFGWDTGQNLKPETSVEKDCTGSTETFTDQNPNCIAIGICAYA